MLNILSIVGMMFAVFLGYFFPRKAGWGTLILAPILGPATFTFVPSGLLPLTTYRVAFGITLGVVLRYSHKRPVLQPLLRSTFVRILLTFSAIVVLVSLEDRLANIIFTYIPKLFVALLLCHVLIRDEKQLRTLTTIFVWQGGLIGLMVLLEFFTEFDIAALLRGTLPDPDPLQLPTVTRADFFRPRGIDGSSVQTAYRLAFLFPLTLWYASRRGLWRSTPLLLVAAALALFQTRAAFVAVGMSLVLLVLGLSLIKGSLVRRFKLLLRLAVVLGISLVVIARFAPVVADVVTASVSQTIVPIFFGEFKEGVDEKAARIPVAIEHFWEKPLLGHGSPLYAYNVVMNTDDIPSPLIYFLSGGIVLGTVFLLLIFYLPYSTFKMSRSRHLDTAQREFLTYAAVAFASGVVVVFSNWQEAHFLVMYLFYMAIYRVFCYPNRRPVSSVVTSPRPGHRRSA